MIEGTRTLEILSVIAFFVLLLAGIFMLVSFYICDSYNCKAFDTANTKGETGSKAYVLTLLGEMYNDGIWPIPYIGSAIATPLSLWFLGVPMTVKNFAIVFFVVFSVIYFMFSFFGHHYIRPIGGYVADYIDNNCPSSNSTNINLNENKEDSDNFDENRSPELFPPEEIIEKTIDNDKDLICEQVEDKESFDNVMTEMVGITFAAPVNVF
ncbi:Hypothetical protein HVR_LOCUS1038 [uncultured virus]|nr:Hypothetical protein HVR_LOCUS1038 [uncultured virus]